MPNPRLPAIYPNGYRCSLEVKPICVLCSTPIANSLNSRIAAEAECQPLSVHGNWRPTAVSAPSHPSHRLRNQSLRASGGSKGRECSVHQGGSKHICRSCSPMNKPNVRPGQVSSNRVGSTVFTCLSPLINPRPLAASNTAHRWSSLSAALRWQLPQVVVWCTSRTFEVV